MDNIKAYIKETWTIDNPELIFNNRERLLKFDLLDKDAIRKFWTDLGDEDMGNHFARKYAEYHYDPALFFVSGCDPHCQGQLALFFNLGFIYVAKLMNFFFWIHNSIGLCTFMELFNDEKINSKWSNFQDSWYDPNAEKTIRFFFSFSEVEQMKLIEKYAKYSQKL